MLSAIRAGSALTSTSGASTSTVALAAHCNDPTFRARRQSPRTLRLHGVVGNSTSRLAIRLGRSESAPRVRIRLQRGMTPAAVYRAISAALPKHYRMVFRGTSAVSPDSSRPPDVFFSVQRRR